MKQGYSPKHRKHAPAESPGKNTELLGYRLGSTEAKAMLDELAKKYPRPAPSVKDVRAMLDHALGERTLTEELYRLRQDD